ncbi:MAG: hypothetical protein WKF70_08935 [Chitinophagaceae bacterium]
MKQCCLILLIAVAGLARSQTVSGLYSGTLYNDTTRMLQSYQLALSEYRGKITGYSYTTFVVNDTFYYGVKSIKGILKNDNLLVEDDKLLANNFPESPAKGIRRLSVIPLHGSTDTITSLDGTWATNRTKIFLPVTGSIQLKRDKDSSHSELMAHLKDLNIIRSVEKATTPAPKAKPSIPVRATAIAAVPYMQRKNKLLETVTCTSDSLLLSFYDNGVVDGDIISVYLNGVTLLSQFRLTGSALKKTIRFTASESRLEITLVAENLGSLPPNTGLMVVQDGSSKYNLNFSADLHTNASIIFRKTK